MDLYSRKIIAWTLSRTLEAPEVLECIKTAKRIRKTANPVIIHADQGIHYTSIDFQKLLKDKGLRQSMSRRGNCWDNAPQESFFGHMKDEIDISRCNTFNDLKAVIDDYIDYYNNERYQWDLAKLSPSEYYQYWLSDIYPIDIKK